jgi:hypothetical protein
MDLPSDIETQIISYLSLEYGSYEGASKLEADDLTYEGEFLIDGKQVKYWRFPCSTRSGCWAKVESYESSYLISMTTDIP